MTKFSTSNKELEILTILWQANQPLTAKEIADANPHLVMSTIQATIKKLLARKLITIYDIVYSGTVLTRNYVPTISQEEFVLSQYDTLQMSSLLAHFLGNQSKNDSLREIAEIEAFLAQKKKEVSKGPNQ